MAAAAGLPRGYHAALPVPYAGRPRAYLAALLELLTTYQTLWRHQAVEFHTSGRFDDPAQTPTWVRDFAARAELDDLVALAARGILRPDWPPELAALMAARARLALPRQPPFPLASALGPLGDMPASAAAAPADFPDAPAIATWFGALGARAADLAHVPTVRQGLTPKKRHEVMRLGALIEAVAAAASAAAPAPAPAPAPTASPGQAAMPPLLPVRDVVDVGAGQGYLDRVLAHGCGLHVLGLDNDTIQTCGAVAPKGGRAAASALKSRSSTVGTLTYRNVHIDHAEQLDAIYRAWRATPGGRSQDPAEDDGPPSRGATEPASASTSAYLLTGLHACGDLGSLILRAWTTCPSAVAVVMVGCCYNRLTESSAVTPTSTNPTFPLSRALRGMNYPLGFTARTLACQALVRWESDPNTPLNFRKHHWRALLQVVLRDHHLIPASPAAATATAMLDGADGTNIAPAACIQVGRLGKAAFKRDFATYALHALAALGAIDHVAAALANPPSVAAPLSPAWAARPGAQLTAHTRVPSRAELVSYEAAYAASERHVAAVWTLRALLAEPLETVILIDRFVAMQEANPAATGPPDLDTPTAATERTVALVPLFDQAVSPRNMVLLGIKPPPPAGSADERPTA